MPNAETLANDEVENLRDELDLARALTKRVQEQARAEEQEHENALSILKTRILELEVRNSQQAEKLIKARAAKKETELVATNLMKEQLTQQSSKYIVLEQKCTALEQMHLALEKKHAALEKKCDNLSQGAAALMEQVAKRSGCSKTLASILRIQADFAEELDHEDGEIMSNLLTLADQNESTRLQAAEKDGRSEADYLDSLKNIYMLFPPAECVASLASRGRGNWDFVKFPFRSASMRIRQNKFIEDIENASTPSSDSQTESISQVNDFTTTPSESSVSPDPVGSPMSSSNVPDKPDPKLISEVAAGGSVPVADRVVREEEVAAKAATGGVVDGVVDGVKGGEAEEMSMEEREKD
ncbi:hypothetical protein P7C71_g3222, partial [Lecanoromycetidae sp. Uapishka_2]